MFINKEEIVIDKEPLIEIIDNSIYVNSLMIYYSDDDNDIHSIHAKLNIALKSDNNKIIMETKEDKLLINGQEIIKNSEEAADIIFIRLRTALKNLKQM